MEEEREEGIGGQRRNNPELPCHPSIKENTPKYIFISANSEKLANKIVM